MTEILNIPTPTAIRKELEGLVLGDLLGPAGGPEEELDEQVRDRYLVGMLAPRKTVVPSEENDELALGGVDNDQEGKTDSGSPQQESLIPSSFGMTFIVARGTSALKVTARWGWYLRVESETLVDTNTGNPKRVWKRKLVEGISKPIPLQAGPIEPWVVSQEQPDVTVKGVVRAKDNGDWIVTIFLVNDQREKKRLADEMWLFQPELLVEAIDGGAAFVKKMQTHDPKKLDSLTYQEERSMAMVYRHQVEFAVGHSVAVHAEPSPNDLTRAVRISTRSVPIYEVPIQNSPTTDDIPALDGLILDMKVLGETPSADLPAKLETLPIAYQQWIRGEHTKIDTDPTIKEFHNEAKVALRNCERACERIKEGLALIKSDQQAAEAFRFANEAMWLQRIHTIFAEKVRRGETIKLDDVDVKENRSWYPFQLAFILLNLPGITNLSHKDRTDETNASADLLWFPTGGGKTEAYLGLAAYTMGLRRLQGEIEGRSGEYGVAVIMRYTLRLLTIQQFQRAAALICSCESIRRNREGSPDGGFGQEPFRIGLWVGMRNTPNTTEQSAEAIGQGHGHYAKGNIASGFGSPAQLTNCPWCGKTILPGRDIKVETVAQGRGRTLSYCSDPLGQCIFSQRQSPDEGIPVMVVDEEIYRRLPTMVIATVDKFAQMPWKGETQMLFGQVNGYCPRHGFRSPEIEDSNSHPVKGTLPRVQTVHHGPLRPPDLIIQDELHLIVGPLGTLVALYETAIDQLSSWEVNGHRVRPKVIASSATVRRAADQVYQLFLRNVEIFPPQALDIRNNFFTIQRDPSEKYPGRRYIGICASGKRIKTALIRTYVAHLAATQKLYEKYGLHADPWMTLVGYFNSMRELGGARRIVDDSVRSMLREMVRRGLANRKAPRVEELTSRKGATEIPEILDWMEVTFNPEDEKRRAALRKEGKYPDTRDPIDVLLATNMVSVGVDVKRLGLMIVAGQPKSSAEYIQATSRVGRSKPGIVCTVFNWARPRDLSHYERFEHYHATFHQHVEPLSVTPFATRSLDRGLTALLVSLVRLTGETFNPNKAAADVEHSHEYIEKAINVIATRAEYLSGLQEPGESVRAMLKSRLDNWMAQAQLPTGGKALGYEPEKDGITKGLLQRPGMGKWEMFTCPTSLREVEPSVGLVLDDHGLDESITVGKDNDSSTGEAMNA